MHYSYGGSNFDRSKLVAIDEFNNYEYHDDLIIETDDPNINSFNDYWCSVGLSLPVIIVRVYGELIIHMREATSLKGCPQMVNGKW